MAHDTKDMNAEPRDPMKEEDDLIRERQGGDRGPDRSDDSGLQGDEGVDEFDDTDEDEDAEDVEE